MAREAVRRVNSRTENTIRTRAYTGAASGYDVRSGRRRQAAALDNVTSRNRSRSVALNKLYMLFLIGICAATVFMCVQFLQYKSVIKSQQRNIERVELELSDLKAENNALYESVTNSIDLDHVKTVAVTRYGMHYASKDQIICYNADNSGYVKQFVDYTSR